MDVVFGRKPDKTLRLIGYWAGPGANSGQIRGCSPVLTRTQPADSGFWSTCRLEPFTLLRAAHLPAGSAVLRTGPLN